MLSIRRENREYERMKRRKKRGKRMKENMRECVNGFIFLDIFLIYAYGHEGFCS